MARHVLKALSFSAWFKGTGSQHLMGVVGGLIWIAGLTALLLAATATPGAGVSRALAFAVSRGSIVAGAVIGTFVFNEFGNYAAARSRALLALGLACAGLVTFSLGGV